MDLHKLKEEIIADGVVDAEEVVTLREILYADGIIDQEEADMLFEINDAVADNDNDPSWKKFFVGAISNFVLADEDSPNEIDPEEFKYLQERIGNDGQVDATELALLINIIDKAEKCCDEFNTYTLECLYQSIIADSVIDEEEVALIRTVVFADGVIDKEEVEFLFKLNDACSGNSNSEAWTNLFVEAISEFVLADEDSPNEIDQEEAQFLIEQIWSDGTVDDVEKALLVSLKNRALKVHSSLVEIFNQLSL